MDEVLAQTLTETASESATDLSAILSRLERNTEKKTQLRELRDAVRNAARGDADKVCEEPEDVNRKLQFELQALNNIHNRSQRALSDVEKKKDGGANGAIQKIA